MFDRCLIAAFTIAFVLRVAAAVADDAPPPVGNFSGSIAFDVDRDVAEALSQAEVELAAGRTSAGLSRLQQLLDRSTDVLIERKGSIVSVWEAVNTLITQLPPAQRDAYEAFVRDQSNRELATARKEADRPALTRLTDRYRHTPSGIEAAHLLATLAFDHGDFVASAAWCEYLAQLPNPSPLPTAVSRLHERATAAIAASSASGPRSGTVGQPATLAGAEWSRDLGVVDDAAFAISGALAELEAQAMTPLLTCRPLVVDGKIITRTLQGLLCVDATSGDVIWEHPIACHASRLAGRPGDLSNPIRTGQVSAILLRRLVRDSLQDELTSDGQVVYTVITSDRTSDDNPQQPANALRAIDIESGATRWEVSRPPPTKRRRRKAGRSQSRYILGPPLIDGDQRLLLTQQRQELELISLDATDGHLLWSVPVGQAVRDLWARKELGDEAAPEDRERQSTACRLAKSGSLILCPTSAGAVVCVDTFRKRLVWAYRYPRRNLPETPTVAGDATYFREMPTFDAFVTAEAWIHDGVGICVAPDADRILAFAMTTGELLWSRPRENANQVLAGPLDSLLVISDSQVTALDFEDGTPNWVTRIRRPLGRGAIHNGRLSLPVAHDQLETLDVSDGKPSGEDPHAAAELISVLPHPPSGLRPVTLRNLQADGELLISQSASVLRSLTSGVTQSDEDPSYRERLAELLGPVEQWRRNAAPIVDRWRGLDSRVRLGDGVLVSLLELTGRRRSAEQKVHALIQQLQQAQQSGDTSATSALERELLERRPRDFYVSTDDGRQSCRLDRWLKMPPTNFEAGDDHHVDDVLLEQATVTWPPTKPIVTEQATNFGIPYFRRIPVIVGDASPWRDVTVEVDRQARQIQFHDARQKQPTVMMLPRETGTTRLESRFLQGWAPAEVLIVRVGTELIAFRRAASGALPTTSLWPANNETLSLLGPRPPMSTAIRERPEEADPAWDTTATGFEDVFGRRLGEVGPVCADFVCYQVRGHLIALEPQTGEELWRRSRLPIGTRAIGDDSHVVLFRATSPELTVLDARDGRTIRQASLAEVLPESHISEQSPFEPQLVNGTIATLATADGDELHIHALDLATGTLLWDEAFPTGSQIFSVDETRMGVAAPGTDEGPFTLSFLDWQTGTQSASWELDAPQPLQQVIAVTDQTQLYVIVSGRITDLPLLNVKQIRGGTDRELVNGWLHSFHLAESRHVWSQPLENVAFPITQPRHVPLLIINDQNQPADTHSPRGRLICIDKRTGETLATLTGGSHLYYALETDAGAGHIDLRMRGRTLHLDYGDEPDSP